MEGWLRPGLALVQEAELALAAGREVQATIGDNDADLAGPDELIGLIVGAVQLQGRPGGADQGAHDDTLVGHQAHAEPQGPVFAGLPIATFLAPAVHVLDDLIAVGGPAVEGGPVVPGVGRGVEVGVDPELVGVAAVERTEGGIPEAEAVGAVELHDLVVAVGTTIVVAVAPGAGGRGVTEGVVAVALGVVVEAGGGGQGEAQKGQGDDPFHGYSSWGGVFLKVVHARPHRGAVRTYAREADMPVAQKMSFILSEKISHCVRNGKLIHHLDERSEERSSHP